MTFIGVQVNSTETPVSIVSSFNSANAYVIGLGDWGAPSGANTPVACANLSNVVSVIGPRSSTNAKLYDTCDAFFHECPGTGAVIYIGRVVGPNPTYASLVLVDGSAATAFTLTANYYGNYGDDILVTIANATSTYVVTLTDTYGTTLAVSPSLATLATGVAWFATTGYVTAVAGGGTLPKTITATAMTGGSDDRTHVGILGYQNALATFGANLGPGQVLAPGVTQTTVPGIWSALGLSALNNGRVAICDCDDNQSAGTIVGDVGTTYNSAGAGPIAFWAGDLLIPGIVSGTTRQIPPSGAIAALCARADFAGNPNLMAAGVNYGFNYILGPASIVSGSGATYSLTDLYTLNSSGVNTFANKFNDFVNYGFASAFTSDVIFSGFNHQRFRMVLQANAQVIGEPFVFSELGQSADLQGFANALTLMLTDYYTIGALYGTSASTSFNVNIGPSVNSPSTQQAGQLNALVTLAMSPGATQVSIVLNAVPITQTLPSAS